MKTVPISLTPDQILNDPLINKGSAFTQEERDALGLHGFLPYHISTIEEQVKRRYENFCSRGAQLSKYLFLSSLQNRNEVLFYRLVLEHVSEMLPYIYTPTVGDVSIQFSLLLGEHRGVYLSYPMKSRIQEIIDNIQRDEIDVIVVTDGERILGLGDLGIGGMAIPVGKLALYTLFGGIHPSRTLPILLDVGTNNKELLNDPLYLGWRHERISGREYDDFVDVFIKAIKKRYPNVLLQWEDFAKPHARPLLDRYRSEICSFNDDIQGTAAVTLSAILSATKMTKGKISKQKIAVLGGGSAGLGICSEILRAMKQEGITESEALKNFYIIDMHGLLHNKLDSMDENQKKFARDFNELTSWKVQDPNYITLLDVVQNVHPNILIGVSAQAGAFTEEIIHTMANHTERPVIFPLSNPTSKSEAKPEDLIKWTKGKAIIATGSPSAPVVYNGATYPVAQCNNVYIFPGVGLGLIASKAKIVSDEMFLKAASILSDYSPLLIDPEGTIFPNINHLRRISREIGIAIAKQAIEEGQTKLSLKDVERAVDQTIWYPSYPTYKKATI